MFTNSKGKKLWIADEAGSHVEVKKTADIHKRPRGQGLPDWWVVEQTPDWRPPRGKAGTQGGGSLLSMGLVAEVDDPDVPGAQDGAGAAAPGAGGVKIGAGGKPQGYDSNGRYTGPRGGSVSLLDGSVSTFGADGRMSANGEEADEADGDEAPREDANASQMTDILLADSGRVVTDAGEGLSGGNEVRGPVTGPEVPEASATLTWKNDDPSKPDPRPEELQPRMRQTLEKMRTGVPELESFNVNSGSREPLARRDPHAEGRAVDVNRINYTPVKDLGKAQGAKGNKARVAAQNLDAWTRGQPEINQVLGPNGGWEFKEGKKTDIPKSDPRIQDHLDHYHINVWKGTTPKSTR